jgi:hypothetical protein
MVLKTIRRRRLVLSSEAKSLKTTKQNYLDRLPGGRSRALFSQAKAKGNYQARVHSDQMVLVIVRWEYGPVA